MECMTGKMLDFINNLEVVDDSRIEEYERQQKEIETKKYLDAVKMPYKYQNVELSDLTLNNVISRKTQQNFDLPQVQKYIDDVATGKTSFLWLCGKPGTGKTTLAIAIAKELCRRLISSKYVKSHEVMQRLEDSKRFSAKETVGEVLADTTSSQFLVVDEIGRWPITEWEKFRLFEITNNLYENFKSGIFITNFTVQELAEYMGKATVDRFIQSGMTIEFQNASFRGTTQELYTR